MAASASARRRERRACGSCRKARHSEPRFGTQRHVAEYHGQHGARPREKEVRRQPPHFVNVLPAEQNVVLLQYGLDLILRKFLADGAAMLVEHHAARLVVHLPAPLPRHETQVRVLQVEGFQQTVEAAEFEELGAVEGAAAAAAVEAGVEIVDCAVDAVAYAQAAVLPPALRKAGLLADLGCIGEENLAGDGEDFGIAEALEQRRQEIGSHPHVAVQQHHDVVLRGAEAGIRSAAEAQVLRQREHRHIGKRCPQKIGAAIRGAVVHHQDLVGRVAGERRANAGNVFGQKVFPVPVGDHHGGRRIVRLPRRRHCRGAAREELNPKQGEEAGRHEERRDQQQRKRADEAFQESHVRARDRCLPCAPA